MNVRAHSHPQKQHFKQKIANLGLAFGELRGRLVYFGQEVVAILICLLLQWAHASRSYSIVHGFAPRVSLSALTLSRAAFNAAMCSFCAVTDE